MKKLLLILLSALILSACTSEPTIPTVSKNIESAVFGAPSSKVQLTIFTDYQCPSCIYFEETIGDELFTRYVQTNKITLTYKNFPLPFHKNAERDALGGLCALSDGKYKEFSKEMYALEETKNGNKVTDEERITLAKKVGLDTANFTQCMSEGWYMNQITKEK